MFIDAVFYLVAFLLLVSSFLVLFSSNIYRSAIFFNDLSEKNTVKAYIQKLENETYKSAKIVTELKEFEIFYEAEDYHKNYFELNKVQSYCHIVISPKVEKFKKLYKERLKKD